MYDGHIPLSEDEKYVLQHNSMWGRDGYPIVKVGSHHWTWGPIRSIKGPPLLFPTKREAVRSFVKYLDSLLERNGEDARRRYIAEHPGENVANG